MLYLIRYAEIGKEPHPEKSKLEKDIVARLESQVASLVAIKKDVGRIFLETKEEATAVLKQIHGISSFSPCIKCTLKQLDKKLLTFANKILKGKKSFGVKVKRVGEHPFNSQEKAGDLGAVILEKYPDLKVDLNMPDEMIFVEIRGQDCYIFNEVILGIDQRTQPSKQVISGPKFIVDDMLGKLAARLRMLGFDATYYGDSADSFMLRKSTEEDRVLLTRDLALTRFKGANALFIKSKKLKDQLKEVIEKYDLKISPKNMFSRCSVCNEPLKDVKKQKAKEKVPPLVYKLFDEFAYCPKCDKYYWKGTHYEKIIEELKPFLS
ncbi:MAG: Mut7-C RNAse domain-containing protein [Candidatus Margulisiibacteriota bacterium]